MELKTGYKQTEIGVIPSDWDLKSVGEIFTFYSTSNFSKAEMTVFGDVGCVHYGLIHAIENSHYSLSEGTKYYVTKEQAKYETIKEGDVIMVDASEDLVGLNKSVEVFNLRGKEFIAGLHTFLLRDNSLNYVVKFRGLILNSTAVKKQMLKLAVGMKVFGVSKTQLQNILISVPPLTEQTLIATALSDADALISSLEKLIAKKRNIKQGAMQKLLQPKEGWEVKKLGEVAEIVGGGTPSSFISSYWNGKINWFTPTEIGENKYTFESARKITKEGFINCSGKMLPVGSILLTTRAGIGDLSILMMEGCTNQGFQSLIAKEGYYNEYLYYLVQTLKNVLIQNASGSTFLEISPNKIKQIEISIPSFEEQNEIATILSDMDEEITALETKLEKYKKVKLGMMQNLLTGKIRLV